MFAQGVFEYDSVANFVAKIGKPPNPSRFVEGDEGDRDNRLIRSRFVVCETKARPVLQDPSEIFSATPSDEAFRLLLSVGISGPSGPDANICMFIDISRAHPHCPLLCEVWIETPASDPRHGAANLCWRLVKTLFGCRDAGRNSELFTAAVMGSLGSTQGVSFFVASTFTRSATLRPTCMVTTLCSPAAGLNLRGLGSFSRNRC